MMGGGGNKLNRQKNNDDHIHILPDGYLVLPREPWFIMANPSACHVCKGGGGPGPYTTSVCPCPNSTPCALDSTVVEWSVWF